MRIAAAMTAGVLAMACLAGCERTAKVAPQHVDKPALPAWQEALSGELHPMADGSAYLMGDGRVYFVWQGKMGEVSGIPGGMDLQLVSLTPLADGTALLVDRFSDPPAAYWLRKETATPVTPGEVTQPGAASSNATTAGYYFVEANQLRETLISPDDCNSLDDDPGYEDRSEYDR